MNGTPAEARDDRMKIDNGPRDMTHIAICICTFKRPGMLRRLLTSLAELETGGSFRLSITVVDNDREGSAGEAVAEFRAGHPLPVHYAIEPQQNISLARNRALRSIAADFYACIDDDEFPDKRWLLELHRTLVGSQAAGALGPIKFVYDVAPPGWLIKGKIQERKAFPTGTVLRDAKYCRTGNVLFSREFLAAQEVLFDPGYGRTGGEDVDFFRRMICAGYRFVWSDEAIVYEVTPPLRQKRSYYLRRALLRGVVQSPQAPLLSLDSLKSLAACSVYTLALPLVFVFHHRSFMPILIRNLDHAGKLLARCGIKPVRSRSDA
jgi:succinoglycan biosynthesis protein ExoM